MLSRNGRTPAAVGIFIACCAALAVVAQPAPAPAAKEEWKTYTKKEFHFSVALPPGWKAIELDPAKMDSSLDELAAANPRLGEAFGPQVRRMVRTGVKFMAVDSGASLGGDGIATTVNVIHNPKPEESTIAEYLAEGVAEFEAMSGRQGKVEHKLIDLEGRKAGWLRFRMVVDPSKKTEVAMTQVYVIARDKSTLVFTFTTQAAEAARYEPIFAAITERIRVLD